MQTTRSLPRLPLRTSSLRWKKPETKTPSVDGGKHVGHLRHDDFTAVRDWCRAMRLGSDAAVSWEAAVRYGRRAGMSLYREGGVGSSAARRGPSRGASR